MARHLTCDGAHALVVNVTAVCRCASNDQPGPEQLGRLLQGIIVNVAGGLIKPAIE